MNIPQKSLAFSLICFGTWCLVNALVIVLEWVDIIFFGIPY